MKKIINFALPILVCLIVSSCQKKENEQDHLQKVSIEKKSSLGTFVSITTGAVPAVSQISLSRTGTTVTATRNSITSSETNFQTINLSGLTISSTGDFSIPSTGIYWLIPFNLNEAPVKLTGFDPTDFRLSCGCTQTGKCGLNTVGQPDNVIRCVPSPAPDECNGECTMKVVSPTTGQQPVTGGSILIEATNIILNGVTYN